MFDEDTGLYYLRARYYDPDIGAFLSTDPVAGDPFQPLSLNRYNYAANDPINLSDPNGEFFTLIDFALTGALSIGGRAFEVGARAMPVCKAKTFSEVVTVAMGLRGVFENLGFEHAHPLVVSDGVAVPRRLLDMVTGAHVARQSERACVPMEPGTLPETPDGSESAPPSRTPGRAVTRAERRRWSRRPPPRRTHRLRASAPRRCRPRRGRTSARTSP